MVIAVLMLLTSATVMRGVVRAEWTETDSTHWLRHTTLTWVERNFSYATARAYAGHTDADSTATTTTYVQTELHEVAAALAALTGEPHPLADA